MGAQPSWRRMEAEAQLRSLTPDTTWSLLMRVRNGEVTPPNSLRKLILAGTLEDWGRGRCYMVKNSKFVIL